MVNRTGKANNRRSHVQISLSQNSLYVQLSQHKRTYKTSSIFPPLHLHSFVKYSRRKCK